MFTEQRHPRTRRPFLVNSVKSQKSLQLGDAKSARENTNAARACGQQETYDCLSPSHPLLTRPCFQHTSTAFNLEKLPPLPQDWMAELARAANSPSPSSDAKAKSDRDARALSELSDDLTVAIALRDWSRAVTLAESARSRPSLSPLISALTSALLDALARPRNRKSTCVELVGHLLRLGAGVRARETFLAARGEAIRGYIRAIPFEGHVGLYVHDLAVVVFTALKHTADWFLAGFVEHEMTSSECISNGSCSGCRC